MRGRLLLVSWLLGACTSAVTDEGADGGSEATNSGVGGNGTTTDASGGAGGGNGANNGSTSSGNTSSSGGAASFQASESVARRLSRSELDNTLGTLLGDDTAPARQFLSEDEFSPYDNDYTLQTASRALIESLNVLAKDVAERAVANEDFKANVLPCTPNTPDDAECFRAIAENLLMRGFRREVESDEVDPYMALLDYATEQVPGRSIDFYTSVGLLIQSVVQDPEFLYRIEVGTPTNVAGIQQLNDHEIASRMSYLLWGDMPDEQLFSEASAGNLSDTGARRALAGRMLESDKSRQQLKRFHAMWLGYRAIPHGAELTNAFAAETNALLDRVLFDEPQSYLNLFTYPETYVDEFLADHYGLPSPSGGSDWVAYGDSGRAGLLSHGSVLSAFSKFSDTSPTQRGILVRTRLMCDEVPPPPPDINTDEPPSDMDANCKIDRYVEHRTNGACAACHAALDPIGFGLENYDMAGRWRDHDDGAEECSIDGQGSVDPLGSFSGPAELAQLLVDAGEIDDCLVRQYLAFALGRPLEGAESELVASLRERFRQSDHSLPSVLEDYVASEAFALRLEPSDP